MPEPMLEAAEPPALAGDALPALVPAADEPAELSELKARIRQGGDPGPLLKALQKLSYKLPGNAEVPFLLGQLYLAKLWVKDGLKLFRKAIELNPTYRESAFLIRATMSGLGNDRDASLVQRFLAQDIGKPAIPYLQEVLHGDWRPQVKERAAALLTEIGASAP